MFKILFQVYKIIKWHKKTFPDFDGNQQKEKLKEEMNEVFAEIEKLTKAKTKSQKSSILAKINEEFADVIIAAINCLRFKRVAVDVEKKMEINIHKRTFVNGHHVEKGSKKFFIGKEYVNRKGDNCEITDFFKYENLYEYRVKKTGEKILVRPDGKVFPHQVSNYDLLDEVA